MINNNYVLLPIIVLLCFVQQSFAPPVTKTEKDDEKKPTGQQQNDDDIGGLEDYMEYHRYLKEVVNALESDPEFRNKLEKAEESDIKSGRIAEELQFVSHQVRTRLDEIKRVELERLKELTEKQRELMNNVDHQDPTHRHLDHSNQHTFEIDDLKKLIAKTTEDLAEADRKRRNEFKEYELQKEYEKQEKLNHTNGDDREKLERTYKEQEEKHKKHEKLHEPGHKAQLEEVWEEQDQMQQEFDPKTFFMLHDLDSNGLWDQDEVKALFVKELDKMYAAGAPEDDMRERAEEMERMRETVFGEVDQNKDGFIDFHEFLAQTKRNDFQQDHGWQGLDEQRPYNDAELDAYIRQHQANQMAGPGGYYQQVPPGGYQQQQQFNPGHQIPPQHQQQQFNPGNQVLPQHQQQFNPGHQVPPQYPSHQLPGHLPDLNTNEIYPPHQQNNNYQQQNQKVPPNYQQQGGNPQPNYNNPPPPPNQQHQPLPPNYQQQHAPVLQQHQQQQQNPPVVHQQQQNPPVVHQQQQNPPVVPKQQQQQVVSNSNGVNPGPINVQQVHSN